ncbi:DUF6183 family protein [Streptomyces sp. NPDC088350]|uniref:DUF6183 family protein n=1 Tax=Streptomyces sp. NPDC088350 TaxID=3365854 RepID=UPI003827F220
MDERISEIVEKLPDLESVTGVWDVADRRHAQGDTAFPADLGIALARRYDRPGAEQVWQYGSVHDHLLRLLAVTPGPENVHHALRLIAATPTQRQRDRYIASLLASGHPAEELAVVFGTGGAPVSDELRACLVQELALRGAPVPELPGVAGWTASPHWSHHPLSLLPLTLSSVEEDAPLPRYGVNGSSAELPYGPSEERGMRADLRLPVPTTVETTTEPAVTLIASAVANWAEESNGRIEARTFSFMEALDEAALPSVLSSLGLKCLDGVGKKSRLSVSVIPATRAWRVLFAAASTGGAYNRGGYGAYGRLAARQSLAGLSGAGPDASAAEIETRAKSCTWYGFEAPTPWFWQVAWDIGVTAVAPDRRSLAVLAASDTD